MAEIFVSYTSSDRDWAFWLGKELEALGHTPHVHEWEIGAGADIYAWMQQHHEAADHVLCVLSDAYMAAPYSTLERNAALWQAASNRPGFVLLVAVTPCKLPSLSDHIRRCELFGVPEDAARLRFREFMARRQAPAATVFPGKAFAVSNIPIRIPEHFLGRDDALAAIATSLKRYEGRVAITALHGLRGVGKTTLAAAFAERHRGDYRATWWLRAQTEAGLRADLVGFGVRLGWVAADEEEPGLAAVLERLRHEGEGILLIYDNAIDANALRPYLPKGGAAQVLITSNAHAWRGMAAPVEIRLWPREIGAEYLVARSGREAERDAAEVLSDALGGLPLAHEQAAAYCERLEITFAEYQRRFDAAPVKLLDADKDAPAEYHDSLTVAKTFALAIDKATQMHPAAEALIVHAALLAPEPIPLFLFAEGREKIGEPLASALADDGLDEVLAALRTFALIDREAITVDFEMDFTAECIRIHRLVRQIILDRLDIEQKRSLFYVSISLIPASLPRGWSKQRSTIIKFRFIDRLFSHSFFNPNPCRILDLPLAYFVWEYYMSKQTSYGSRFNYWKTVFLNIINILIDALGTQHLDVADCMIDYAFNIVLDPEAIETLNQAINIYEKSCGYNDPRTGYALMRLAVWFMRMRDFSSAKENFIRAIKIMQDHELYYKNVDFCLRRLSKILCKEGRYLETYKIYEDALGKDNKNFPDRLQWVAYELYMLGRLSEAHAVYQRSFDLSESINGLYSTITADIAHAFAALLRAENKQNKSNRYFMIATQIRREIFGKDHYFVKDAILKDI